MKKVLCLLASVLLLLLSGPTQTRAGAEGATESRWTRDERARLTVGNPTPMEGKFFTSMWGGSTSDLDVQNKLHAYSPVIWDGELGRFRFDHSVVEDVLIMDDAEGNRSYLMVLADDLYYSDGTQITATDYAFSLLFQMDPVIAETGGQPKDCSWLLGADEYIQGKTRAPAGLRLVADNMLQITVGADVFPYFYEPAWLQIYPYPITEIAPGTKVVDDGDGARLSRPLTAEGLRQTVLNEKNGYLSHPGVVSGPYILKSFDGTTATFVINTHYKGDEDGMRPRIGELVFTLASNADMVDKLKSGEYGLLNKVTRSSTITAGIELLRSAPDTYAMENETRTGLTMIWFMESSPAVQDLAVRQAIAACFDRKGFIRETTGIYGMQTDGFYGLGQWMFQIASGITNPPKAQAENQTKEQEDGEEAQAWETINLDGLTLYELDTEKANSLLNQAGWTLNQDGQPFESGKDPVRYKKIGDKLIGLNLTIAIPEAKETRDALKTYLEPHLEKAGIALTIRTVSMKTLQGAYKGETDNDFDLLYLGENFEILFDPEKLIPRSEGTELGTVKQELYQLACDMVHTEPADLAGFLQKWVTLQERITATLPLLPVYTNVYFDFYCRTLHNYRITNALTWGEAIVSSYISDIEEMDEETQQQIQEQLAEFDPQREEQKDTETP